MAGDPLAVVLLQEVAAVLVGFGRLACAPTVEEHGSRVTLTLTVNPSDPAQELEAARLFHELQYVADVGNLRGFALRYGIDPARLEALLERRED